MIQVAAALLVIIGALCGCRIAVRVRDYDVVPVVFGLQAIVVAVMMIAGAYIL